MKFACSRLLKSFNAEEFGGPSTTSVSHQLVVTLRLKFSAGNMFWRAGSIWTIEGPTSKPEMWDGNTAALHGPPKAETKVKMFVILADMMDKVRRNSVSNEMVMTQVVSHS